MRESDHDYFGRRAAEEREAAGRASDPLAKRAHLELAQRYDEIVAAIVPAQVIELRIGGTGSARRRG
jgi:hypothetical protein